MKVVLLLAFIGAAYCSPAWNNLEAPWNPNPLQNGFHSLPRTASAASSAGWTQQNNFCAGGGPFMGKRYWYKNDPTRMLIYDCGAGGYIGGIQFSMPKTYYTPSQYMMNHPVVPETLNGQQYYTMTAYFVSPAQIKSGRDSSQYAAQGTGDGTLRLQNGTSYNTIINIPSHESDLQGTNWVGPKCFWTMGNHYWYNLSPNMGCDQFFPFCLLYNGGKLNAFCFGTNGYLNSKYVDRPHPTPDILSKFFKIVPKCFAQTPAYSKLTTMHVYLTSHPIIGDRC